MGVAPPGWTCRSSSRDAGTSSPSTSTPRSRARGSASTSSTSPRTARACRTTSMRLSRTSSSSPIELGGPAPGDEVAGFRLERLIGHGQASVVFEATQTSLDRRVALKLLPERPPGGLLRWPEHPHVVSLYAAGPCEFGYFIAMQLVRGKSIDELSLSRTDRQRVLADVSGALDAAHRAGVVHGAVSARNVLVDRAGRGYLTDFGLGPPFATPESDRAALAELEHAAPARLPWRWALPALAAIGVAAATAALVL